jgi:pyridoxine kinase
MGFETALAPTVLFGRHPGLGPPGGGPVPPDMFSGILAGIEANGALADASAVITGYFASAEQVAAATRLIDAARATNPATWIVVDPVMGDEASGLYVPEAVAEALVRHLMPRADLITPNAWELARLSGRPASDVEEALAAARSLGRPVLASSVMAGDEIGVIYASPDETWLASHARHGSDPKGAGDRLVALIVGHRLKGETVEEALRAAVARIAEQVTGGSAQVRMARL